MGKEYLISILEEAPAQSVALFPHNMFALCEMIMYIPTYVSVFIHP